MTGVEAGGRGSKLGEHAARFALGRVGVFQGTRTYILQDENGQIGATHSLSAGLDYAGVGPEHAFLRDEGRVRYAEASDAEALSAFQLVSRYEGILPALESSHALAYVHRQAKWVKPNHVFLVNLSGRGDKDLDIVEQSLNGRSMGGDDA